MQKDSELKTEKNHSKHIVWRPLILLALFAIMNLGFLAFVISPNSDFLISSIQIVI